jgi:hypothetical protein
MLVVCLGAGWTTLLDRSSPNVAVPAPARVAGGRRRHAAASPRRSGRPSAGSSCTWRGRSRAGYFGATLALNLVLSLFLQDGLHLSPLAAALTLPGAIGFAAASAASAGMVSRFGTLLCLALLLAALLLAVADGLRPVRPAARASEPLEVTPA